jgi:hypothetical protein
MQGFWMQGFEEWRGCSRAKIQSIAGFSWVKYMPETRFLKETGFLSTSPRMKTAISQVGRSSERDW